MKKAPKSQEKQEQARHQYFSTYYEKHKAEKKETQRKNYLRKKAEREQKARNIFRQTYTADNIRVLMSFKQYTELRAEKKRKWTELAWTMRDLVKNDVSDVSQIQQLQLLAGNLVRDYYETAKRESGMKSKWNSLSEEKQQNLIKFWAREKVWENEFLAEQREKKNQEGRGLEKDIEMAKFHEERGKVKCDCWQCEKEKEARKEVKREWVKELEKGQESEEREEVESECGECYENKMVSVDSGLCRKCEREEGED